MADTNCTTNENPDRKHIEALFSEICTEVALIKPLLDRIATEFDSDAELYSTVWAVETFVSKIGWIADIGSNMTGGILGKGIEAEEWFLSPAYLKARKEAESRAANKAA